MSNPQRAAKSTRGTKLTPKQEQFCLDYLETGNATEAYRRSYSTGNMKPEVINVKASELLSNGKVSVRLAELRKPVVEKAQLTLEAHLQRLFDLSSAAEQEGQFSAAITAEVSRGKACGFYVERSVTTNQHEVVQRVQYEIVEPEK